MELITVKQAHSGAYAHYYGDRPEWLMSPDLGTYRDADLITQSNFEVLTKWLQNTDSKNETWTEESSRHWAVGYMANVLVKPGTRAETILRDATKAITEYPVLDEEHYWDLEFSECELFWDQLSISERVKLLQDSQDSVFAARASYGDLLDRASTTAESIWDRETIT